MDFFNNLRLFMSLRAVVLAEKPLFFKELLEDAKRSDIKSYQFRCFV